MNERLAAILFVLVFLGAVGGVVFTQIKKDNSSMAIQKNEHTTALFDDGKKEEADIPSNVPAKPETQLSNPTQQSQQSFPQAKQQQVAGAQAQQAQKQLQFPGILPAKYIENKKIGMKIANKGIIEFELFDKEAPKTVSNFVYLTSVGFYNGLTFHRVEPGFVIQGGDPRGNGTGGPGYKFEDEPVKLKYEKGIVAMANAGPNTNGSQFFIMLGDHPELPPNYTIFGKVITGQDVVDSVQVGDVMEQVVLEDNPAQPAP